MALANCTGIILVTHSVILSGAKNDPECVESKDSY